jgi:peptidoglycan/xylan/chitin deacetylase (PgdA/CDA1 family)
VAREKVNARVGKILAFQALPRKSLPLLSAFAALGREIMNFDRRRFLSSALSTAAGVGALGSGISAGLGPNAANAQALIALPNDIVEHDAATITAVRTSSPVVAMTFDDGPHPRHTPRLLDMLKARGMRATFYLIGNRVVQYPDIARRIAEEGHEIGNHSWSHPFLNRLGNTAVINEIDRTTDAIWNATGRPPVTFRPPYGAFNRRQRLMLHEVRSFPTILWDVDPQDWRRPGSSVVARRILANMHQGSIILSHDIHGATVDAMPATLDGFTRAGLQTITVSEMIGWPRWQNRNFRRVVAGS